MTDGIDIFSETEKTASANAKKVAFSWVDKYDPKTLADLVIEENTRKMFQSMIDKHDISNMSLFGSPGIGKTTIALMLAKLVNAEVCFIPCGTDGTVDTVRNRIVPFCESASSGRIKCVILDEFDSASGSSASTNGMQKALRSLMEMYSDVRFIITCNYPKKIIEPIFSRCPKVHIGYTLKDVACRLKYIWEQEGIEFDKETAREFCLKVVAKTFPDIRETIRIAEMFCSTGKLVMSEDSQFSTSTNASDEFIQSLFKSSKEKSLNELKQVVMSNMTLFNGDFELFASSIGNYALKHNYSASFIGKVCEYAYRMSQVSDPSLQMIGILIEIKNYKEYILE